MCFILKHIKTRIQTAQEKYTKTCEQCLEWDTHPHLLPYPLFHFSSSVPTMDMRIYSKSHFLQIIWIYSNLIHSYTSNNNYPMTTSNLMHLQHSTLQISKKCNFIGLNSDYFLSFAITKKNNGILFKDFKYQLNMPHLPFLHHVGVIYVFPPFSKTHGAPLWGIFSPLL